MSECRFKPSCVRKWQKISLQDMYQIKITWAPKSFQFRAVQIQIWIPALQRELLVWLKFCFPKLLWVSVESHTSCSFTKASILMVSLPANPTRTKHTRNTSKRVALELIVNFITVLLILSSCCLSGFSHNIHHLLCKDPASDLQNSACVLFRGKIAAGTDSVPVCDPLSDCLFAASQ